MGLRGQDRTFIAQVARAAFANPFGEERAHLDAILSGRPREDPTVLDVLTERVSVRLAELRARHGDAHLNDEGGHLAVAFAFEQFYRFATSMDALIRRQRREKAPCRVPFAHELLSRLTNAGFEERRAERLLALFFQMRRAWFFIGESLVGQSRAIGRLRESLWNAVFTRDIGRFEELLHDRMEDFSILLLGETGTGKGAAAAAIGRCAFIPYDAKREVFLRHFEDGFLAINLSQFSESILESELFGHKKGAFTGAIEAHPGVFGRCIPHGTIFLDEIGELSPSAQIKLLRVLQERAYSPVGSHEQLRFEGRVLAATNRTLDVLRGPRGLREDFYYRLSSHHVIMPSLRERVAEDPAELDGLVAHLLGRMLGRTEAPADLYEEVRVAVHRDRGVRYAWPGNVRELEQAIRRVLLTGSCALDAPAAPRASQTSGEHFFERIQAGDLSAEELLQEYCALLYQEFASYVDVARRTGLDRRTVKKYVTSAARLADSPSSEPFQ